MNLCSKCNKKEADKIIENKGYCNKCALLLMQQIREMFSYNQNRA